MRRLTKSGWLAAISAAGALVATTAGAAAADPAETTHVDDVAVTVGANFIAVTGQATFMDVPMQVAEDPLGDSVGNSQPASDDLATAFISRPDPFRSALTFTVDIANQSDLDGTPELLMYAWEFTVTTPAGESTDYQIRAQRSGQANSLGAEPYFVLATCETDVGRRTCTTTADLDGRMGGGSVEWDVKLNNIGATPESVISPASNIVVSGSTSGLFWGLGILDQAIVEEDYIVPEPTAQIGIAPAGTLPELVPLTGETTLQTDGSFSGIIPRPSDPGDYVLVVKACHGPGNCGLATTTFTI